MASAVTEAPVAEEKLVRGLGLLDSTMLVAGSMIGSGIFIVSSIIARQVGSPGWLLVVWIVTGLLTLTAALSYGELAAMMPKAGGQYVYLREAFSPLWGFLYGWTLFLVIQTGTIAAVSVAFARFLSIVFPPVSEGQYLVPPIHISSGYAFSLSTAQFVAIVVIAVLTFTNSRGLEYGKIIQWFEAGNKVEISDDMTRDVYFKELDRVKGLRELTKKHMPSIDEKYELPSVMEFVLDGLHQNSKIAKDEVDHTTAYKDLVGSIFAGQGKLYEED